MNAEAMVAGINSGRFSCSQWHYALSTETKTGVAVMSTPCHPMHIHSGTKVTSTTATTSIYNSANARPASTAPFFKNGERVDK